MPWILRSVIERVTRGGRSVVSPRNFSSCPNCRNVSEGSGDSVVGPLLSVAAGYGFGVYLGEDKKKKAEEHRQKISEAMDIRTRQGLLNALAGKAGKRMDSLLVPLELLCCVSRTEFSDKKAYLRWQKRQLNILAEGLINNPVVGFGESGRKATDLKNLLLRIEESESLPSSAGEVQRAECLKSLREVAMSLAERQARGDLTGEVCHWADGYHLNVRLYEKLLLCVFDMLNEGKLTEPKLYS